MMENFIWWLQAGAVFLVVEAAILYGAFALGFLWGEQQGNANWREIQRINNGGNIAGRRTINIQ